MKSELVVVISFNSDNTTFASWHIFTLPQRVVVVFSAQWAFSIFELNIYVLYVQYVYTQQFRVSTSDVVVHCIQDEVHSLTPKKFTIMNGNSVFLLREIFHDRNIEVKQDLPAVLNIGCAHKNGSKSAN